MMDYKTQEQNVFEWTFTRNSNLQYQPLESPHFKFYGSETCVYRKLKRTNNNEYVQFAFRSLIPNGRRVFHRTGIVDNKGREYFTSIGQLFAHTDNVLMIISYQNYFLPQIQNGLVFRFTWFEDEACCVSISKFLRTGNSIQISECSIQTDVKQPVTTRDSSTETGNSIQISERSTQTDVIQPVTTRNSSIVTESLFQICNRGIQVERIQCSRDSSTATESSIIVHECGSQTEGIESLPSNDISTNTEISMNMQRSAIQMDEIQPLNSSTDTDEEQNALLKILSDQLGCFYEGQANTDCVLQVGESQFPVHRSVLSARSKVFERMFYHDTSESQRGIVNIQDVDAVVVDDVMYYIYTGKIRGLSPDTAISIYDMADKYGLIELKEMCLKFLKENITMNNVCDVALMAHVHAELELGKQVILFIEMRLEDLRLSDNWKIFSEDYPKLAMHLISSAFFLLKNRRNIDPQ